MAKAYEDKLSNPTIMYEGTDQNMVNFLSSIWNDNSENDFRNETNYGDLPTKIDLEKFKNTLSRISNNLVFRGNFGAYNDKLEKEMSLTKKSVLLNKSNCKDLYLCLNDFIKYNSIRPELLEKIKYADVFIKHKKGDNKDPKNFRFLSNHSKIYKILDKFVTNNLISTMERNNCLPDISIVKNNFNREFTLAIRDLALEKLSKYHSGKKIVLLDIKKAFDSVSWKVLYEKVKMNLTRKVSADYATKIMNQYMFLNCNRVIKYKDNIIDFGRSIATGLPSSTLMFSLLIEQLVFEWKQKEDTNHIIINTFVDDIYLEFSNTIDSFKYIDSLVKFLKENGLIINEDKTKTNIDSLPYIQINKSDCYLGLPFARNIKDYINECIKMFNEKYYNITKPQIIEILKEEKFPNIKKEIYGFFNYKFYGLKNFNINDIDVLVILEKD